MTTSNNLPNRRRAPAAPTGLGEGGEALWKSITTSIPEGWELDERELHGLAHVCRLEDELASLEVALKRDGVTVAGSKGQPRVHPGLAEARQHRLAQARLLASLRLEPPEEASPGVRQARKAAQARWDRRRQVVELREAG